MNNSNTNQTDILIDTMKAHRLQTKILKLEKENIRSKSKNDPSMVKAIKTLIEEEVKCL